MEHIDTKENILIKNLLTQVYDEEIVNSNLDKFMKLLKKGKSVRKRIFKKGITYYNILKYKFPTLNTVKVWFILIFKINKYYEKSQRDTDNAWIEVNVVHYHYETGELLTKLPLSVWVF